MPRDNPNCAHHTRDIKACCCCCCCYCCCSRGFLRRMKAVSGMRIAHGIHRNAVYFCQTRNTIFFLESTRERDYVIFCLLDRIDQNKPTNILTFFSLLLFLEKFAVCVYLYLLLFILF